LNQHIKLKHPEYYQQMSANNQNLAGMSKRDSTLNNDDGKSLSDSYGGRGSISDDDESSDEQDGRPVATRRVARGRRNEDEEEESYN
jgi:hypothetical protein